MRDFVQSWTHGADWRTWVAHSAIALVLSGVAGALFDAEVAVAAPVGYYGIRELEQLLYGYVDRNLDRDWLDHVLDVVAPAVTVLAVWGWWL